MRSIYILSHVVCWVYKITVVINCEIQTFLSITNSDLYNQGPLREKNMPFKIILNVPLGIIRAMSSFSESLRIRISHTLFDFIYPEGNSEGMLIVFQLRPTPIFYSRARLGGREKDLAAYITTSQMWWSKIATWLSLFKALAPHLLMLLEIWGVIEQIPSNPANGSFPGHWLNRWRGLSSLTPADGCLPLQPRYR